MKASETRLLHLLQSPKQFTIPIYQRPYSWRVADCERLLRDTLQVGKDSERPTYFVGSVVYFRDGAFLVNAVPTLLVIDGQQRLTTTLLLLTALAEWLETAPDEVLETLDVSSELLRDEYLTNRLRKGDLKYKLLLSRHDKETLNTVVERVPQPPTAAARVLENLMFFRGAINADTVGALWRGLQKLMVVEVSLEAGIDNPQLIFESLNSTGKPLEQADLIRNYVLMGQDTATQERLYEAYWFPMEQAFGDAYGGLFSWYVRDFLTVQTGTIPNVLSVYDSFKADYAKGKTEPAAVEAMARALYTYAGYYVRLRLPEQEPTPSLRAALQDLRELEANVAYPFLLNAYAAYASGKLTTAEMTQVVRLIEAYVLRRAICEIPTNSMNRMFATLGRQIDDTRYVASLQEQLLNLGANRRFPLDAEFRQYFVLRDTYNKTRTRTYLLERLENNGRNERVNISEYTIEHIMPQNRRLRPEWREMLGDDWKQVQEKYLHTIGNLTLTGYNSSLSDRPFAEKRTMPGGFVSSPIQLNASVAAARTWNAKTIERRANLLADWAIAIWPAPQGDPAAEAVALAEEEPVEEIQDELELALLEELEELPGGESSNEEDQEV